MKSIALLTVMLTAFAVRAFTQATPDASPASSPAAAEEKIVMSSGALAKIKDGHATRLDMETVLSNGARVTPGGTVNASDGSTATLRDGQQITMDGKISAAPALDVQMASSVLSSGTSGPGVAARDTTETMAQPIPTPMAMPSATAAPMNGNMPMPMSSASASPMSSPAGSPSGVSPASKTHHRSGSPVHRNHSNP